MAKLAFVFSGQGDQFPGMGKELYDSYEEAKAVFRMCDAIRPGTSEQCFDGSEEELKKTVNAQPCLYAAELAAAEVLKSRGICPDMAAGFSLGEMTACAFSGVFSPEEGFRLVIRRGELMQEAAEGQETFMAAVLKLGSEETERICAALDEVYPVNYNCPGQIVVSGSAAQKEQLNALVREAGGRMMPLKVSGAFHSPFMSGAAEAFRKELESGKYAAPEITLYSDVTAAPYDGSMAVPEMLSRQIISPVRWEELVRNMIRSGMGTCVEIGPGRTLSGMVRRIDPAVRTYATAGMVDIQTLASEVTVC